MTVRLRHFRLIEFDSPDEPGSGRRMDPAFLRLLDEARDRVGPPRAHHTGPWIITSGYRTPAHNAAVGGVPNSAHTRGLAADISIEGWPEGDVVALIAALSAVGLRRIGRARTFVHVDADPTKPTPAYWDYLNGPDHVA